jgi:hypothetical protein
MSYQQKVEEMVGKHVAEYQLEVSLAKQIEGYRPPPPMPYGYPLGIYRPAHFVDIPRETRFASHLEGKMSNGVPRILGMDLEDQYILGLYNPAKRCLPHHNQPD